ncbi:ion transporter [Algoriphagus zhangzhouensis]|uniref:Voltage-gated potassium channel n=1 Tax=Algoriphagus zhangzhouensis TaxID=1073327 RepID=A0A1M7Z9Z6_9BACT|nr:ion transporter [Algoriphagus zhangzhouensis]TDY47271.1 voltage-gated potassium channel [Algoriphagus zhangzhouensis]SHO61733.1 voltage-gated potassium channel [Algoriphagus zhangzhouensis]
MSLTKRRLAHIVFESNDRASKMFDVILLILIFGSVIVAILDSVADLRAEYGRIFFVLELVFTFLFTIEYILRVWLTSKTMKYVFSFYGIVDLLAILPVYLSFFIANVQLLTVVRALRLLRVVRILKLGRYLAEADFIQKSLKASLAKIQIFLFAVITIVLIMGTLMYIIEGPETGFTSIPRSMYWAIVTLTTVGFGDITPETPLGQFVASLIMLLGYAIIAVPTGIVSAEMAKQKNPEHHASTRTCTHCGKDGLDRDDHFCKNCGYPLD